MKKLIIALILSLSIGTAYGATYTLTSANYDVKVNGQKVYAQPYNLNGTTLLSVREISDALGVPIKWNNDAKCVEIDTVDLDGLKEACVMLQSENNDGSEQGSGVYIDYGVILTANHVVHDGNYTETSDGKQLVMQQQNPMLDAATLTVGTEIKPVKLGDSDDVKFGDKVIVVASPSGKEDTVIYATVTKINQYEFMIDADCGGGSSGGGVFNQIGELIGILVSVDNETHQDNIVAINGIRKSL